MRKDLPSNEVRAACEHRSISTSVQIVIRKQSTLKAAQALTCVCQGLEEAVRASCFGARNTFFLYWHNKFRLFRKTFVGAHLDDHRESVGTGSGVDKKGIDSSTKMSNASPSLAFGSYDWICSQAALVVCPLLGSSGYGIEPVCYARNVELGKTIIFQPGQSPSFDPRVRAS